MGANGSGNTGFNFVVLFIFYYDNLLKNIQMEEL